MIAQNESWMFLSSFGRLHVRKVNYAMSSVSIKWIKNLVPKSKKGKRHIEKHYKGQNKTKMMIL